MNLQKRYFIFLQVIDMGRWVGYGSHLQEVGISKLSSLAHSNSLSKKCHSLENRRDNYIGSENYNFAIEYVEYTIRG